MNIRRKIESYLYRIHFPTLFRYFLGHHKSDFVMTIFAQVSDVAYQPLVYSKIFFYWGFFCKCTINIIYTSLFYLILVVAVYNGKNLTQVLYTLLRIASSAS